jgi:uncharacterized membrane protein (UPF0136 family)
MDMVSRELLVRKLEWWLVLLIAFHTYGIGVALLGLPEWALRFGGWETLPPLFFPRQAGVFHFVLGTGYLFEYLRLRSVSLLLTAKACGAVFLLAATLLATVPWFVTFAGVADGLMGIAVLVMRRWANRTTVARSTPLPS